MNIVERRETWIHTHFLTDCIRLPSAKVRRIRAEIEPFLRHLGIVYSIHFVEHKGKQGIRIVLECIPFFPTLDEIQTKLAEIVKDIPARPQPVLPRVEESNMK